MIASIRQFYIKHLTGCYIGGLISESLNLELFNPLLKVFGTVDGVCRLEFVFDYNDIRYHLLLQHNDQVEHCIENNLLGKVAQDVEEGCAYEDGVWKCLDIFWPVVAKDSLEQAGKTTEKATIKTRFQRKETIKIQLLTKKDGVFSERPHNERSLYPLSEPILNPCPPTVRVFAMEEVEFLQEIWGNVFKAKIGDDLVCVKVAPAGDLRAEIEALLKAPHHPHVIHPLLGVVDAGNGYIDKFVIPFIEGKQLAFVREATKERKETWKKQLSDAVLSLHEAGITWGDGSKRNVMIDKETEGVVVIDLAFSYFDGQVASERKSVEAEKLKDLAMLILLNEYIDNLPLARKSPQAR